jgi:hypothetical protein
MALLDGKIYDKRPVTNPKLDPSWPDAILGAKR